MTHRISRYKTGTSHRVFLPTPLQGVCVFLIHNYVSCWKICKSRGLRFHVTKKVHQISRYKNGTPQKSKFTKKSPQKITQKSTFTQKSTLKSKITQKSCSKNLLNKKIILKRTQKRPFKSRFAQKSNT